ncbi:GIY-YIG nuclease family protein [Chloroflexota bacterium]
MQPATIKLFLAGGAPDRLRTAELSNWTGKAISGPRSELKTFLSRDELDKPGIYILTGTDSESGEPTLYIGEAECVSKRIKGHSDKDFWVNATAFISKDENLTKTHCKYLEGKLIEKATEARRAKVLNAVSSGARLPEPDAAEMEVFLYNIYQLLPILGINLFQIPTEQIPSGEEKLHCRIKGLEATGNRTSGGFVIYEGSQAVVEHRPSAKHIRLKRDQLIQIGILENRGTHLEFTRDYEFGSPSTAGGVVRGGNTNGLTQWRTADGRMLKELEESETSKA